MTNTSQRTSDFPVWEMPDSPFGTHVGLEGYNQVRYIQSVDGNVAASEWADALLEQALAKQVQVNEVGEL